MEEQEVGRLDSYGRSETVSSHTLSKVADIPRKYVCSACTMLFNTKEEMMKHISTVHMYHGSSERIHECPQCKILFNCTFDLNLHMCGHRKDVIVAQKSETCSTISFSNSGFECNVCGKMVGTKGNLAKHMLLHSGDKPYNCEICGKSFSIKGNRDKHRFTHSEERPHECHICNKKFTLKGNLQQHILTHMDRKMFKCVVCEKDFTLKGNLLKHLKRHENGMRIKRYNDLPGNVNDDDDNDPRWSINEEDTKDGDKNRELVSAIINNFHETSKSAMSNLHEESQSEIMRNLHESSKSSLMNNLHEASKSSLMNNLHESSKSSVMNNLHEANKSSVMNNLHEASKSSLMNNLHEASKSSVMNNLHERNKPAVSNLRETFQFGNENLERLSNEAVRLKDQYERQELPGDVKPSSGCSYSGHLAENNQRR